MSKASELEAAFNDWFIHQLFQQPSCLMRDVLRDCRKELFKAWMNREPVHTSAEPAEPGADGERGKS